MKYRTLGRTELRCSEIGLGTWTFASQVYGAVAEADAINAIRAALDVGINFFDTAPLYGTPQRDGVAEEILGKGLGKDRDKIIISSKFGRNSSEGNAPNFHAKRARQSVEESLRRLRTDRLEILFFHSPFSAEEIHDDVWEALDKLKTEGKIRFIGHSISMFQNTQQMTRNWAAERKIDVIQVVYSLLNREAADLMRDLGKEKIGVVARESLANGFLSGTITKDTQFPPDHLNARYSREEISERVEQVQRLGFLVRDDIKNMPQAAMRWVLDDPHVSLVLSGAKNQREILGCAAAAEAKPYSSAELQKAETLHYRDFQAA
ncbi:aldo/keto reductase [candidate division KSB1 bacterium]|nr:aldo/keto reductase [candidate division KSB1 bacterium]